MEIRYIISKETHGCGNQADGMLAAERPFDRYYTLWYRFDLMTAPTPLLSPQEMAVLRHLARGKNYQETATEMKVSIYHIHTICHGIRRKTGIRSTKDNDACALYWKELHSSPMGILPTRTYMPTPGQLGVLRLVAQGTPYNEIAHLLDITEQTARNQASQGCIKIGIGGMGNYRVLALVEWMKKHSLWVEPDPLNGY